MLRLPILFLLQSAAQAFVGGPNVLIGRGNAVYTKGWGSRIARHTSAARQATSRRGLSGSVAPPSMSLMLLAEDAAKAAPDIPISPEQQESIISVLSVLSSVLLLIIISGAVYLSLEEWKNKKELKETEKYTSAGQLPPDIAPEALPPSDGEEEGNRLQRRMAKKERRKSGKV
ncbi:unnamed protein product [Ectocarpus sp. 12 AP-2014]